MINKEIDSGGGRKTFSLYMDANGYVWFVTSNGSNLDVNTYYDGPHEPFDDGQWHQAVGTVDGQNMRLYVDGVLKRTKQFTGIIESSNLDTLIGYRGAGSVNTYAIGKLDETRLYNRALSPDEVLKLYEWAPGPAAWWKMDEKISGNNKTIYDVTGNGHDGKIYWGANAAGMDCTVAGKFGSACQFDGTDDYMSVPASSLWNFLGKKHYYFFLVKSQ